MNVGILELSACPAALYSDEGEVGEDEILVRFVRKYVHHSNNAARNLFDMPGNDRLKCDARGRG